MEEANLQVEQEQPEVIKRPGGVTFWGVLSIITGIALLVMLIGWGQRITQAANEFGALQPVAIWQRPIQRKCLYP